MMGMVECKLGDFQLGTHHAVEGRSIRERLNQLTTPQGAQAEWSDGGLVGCYEVSGRKRSFWIGMNLSKQEWSLLYTCIGYMLCPVLLDGLNQ